MTNSYPPYPVIKLQQVSWIAFSDKKQLTYEIETDTGAVCLSVMVPYCADDREADRLGRVELRKILGTLAMAA